MSPRPMTEDEADDHWTEYGRETPVEVWSREREERQEAADGDAS